ncbi:hypothetical protein [Spirosoma pollinicola]|uniref:Uncharacterized protein n=1 Tax=Spirosoma pollinicola TaxID=2057025 RepID=A0A2K8YTI9_9BACT|nr:hypothetical protein [Spirosoma pollinicola]AUD00940.1 hypothetical protein CWM47_03380 [Spirosoma pollinicola]
MAKQDKKTEGAPGPKATVIAEFRCINNFDVVYEVGDDVSDFNADRLAKLEAGGLIEIEKPAEQTPPPAQ